MTTYENPYNRKDSPEPGDWIVVVLNVRGVDTATRSAFATREDASHYANSVASCYHPMIAQLEAV